MLPNKPFELPVELQPKLKKAQKLEWITLIYLSSVVVLMYLVMGSSQAMKTAWLEDTLSLLPGIAFLIAHAIYNKKPTPTFPYGYHRVFGIAFLAGSVALFSMGCFLFIDSAMALIHQEHPTIGTMMLFGHQVWMGYIMISVLLYSSIPAVFLGEIKRPLAVALHNKILYTDAVTQKADYQTAFAAILGIIGIGFGLWWADAVAAIFISGSVIKDGYFNLKNSIEDLMDSRPVDTANEKEDELLKELKSMIDSWEWVQESALRFREHGQVYFGEILVVPQKKSLDIEVLEEAAKKLVAYHWKIQDVTIMPVSHISKHNSYTL